MLALPQNLGSWFLALCVAGCAAVSSSGMAILARSVGMRDRFAARLGIVFGLVVFFAVLLPLRYAAPALAPLVVVELWLLAAWCLARQKPRPRTRRLWGALTAAYAIALVCGLWVAGRAIAAADTLRHLSLDDVQRITIEGPEGTEAPIVIADETQLAQVLEALASSVPYQPDRESFSNGYRVTVHAHSGPIRFVMYRGRNGRLDTVVLELSPGPSGPHLPLGHYESQPLYWLLVTRYRLPAWFRGDAQDQPPL